MKVLFFGTPEFSKEVLSFLLKSGVNICGVISKPDKPKGRSKTPVSTPVKAFIQDYPENIPLWQPEKVSDLDFRPVIEALQPDLFVVVAYGEIIKEHLLSLPKLGAINLHTSLLPKWRGAAPVQRAIMAGDNQSGVTIIHLVKKMDAGDMLAKATVPISEEMTYGELEKQLLEVGKPLLLKTLQDIKKGLLKSEPQNPEEVTFAPKVELEDCQVFWNRTAEELHNLIRGSNPEPGAWCFVLIKGEKRRLKLFKSKVSLAQGSPGEILSFEKNSFIVGCKDQSLELLEVQPEGKKRMSAGDFIRGLNGALPTMM